MLRKPLLNHKGIEFGLIEAGNRKIARFAV
jgi:hypothetical protein